MDIGKLSPAPWTCVTCGTEGHGRHDRCYGVRSGGKHLDGNPDDKEFIALARNDLDVKMRRGWHTEKCIDLDQWYVPHLVKEMLRVAFEQNREDIYFDAAYQDGHDVGLLTKADRWATEHGL